MLIACVCWADRAPGRSSERPFRIRPRSASVPSLLMNILVSTVAILVHLLSRVVAEGVHIMDIVDSARVGHHQQLPPNNPKGAHLYQSKPVPLQPVPLPVGNPAMKRMRRVAGTAILAGFLASAATSITDPLSMRRMWSTSIDHKERKRQTPPKVI